MTEKGEEYLNKAFDIKGNSAEDYAWRGRIYYYLGQYDNAQTELKSALDKESVIANLYIAQVYEAQGDPENAEVYYQNYVNSGSADSQAMNALGEIEMAKGNYSGALTYLEQGIAMENVTNRRELMQNLIIVMNIHPILILHGTWYRSMYRFIRMMRVRSVNIFS